MKIFETKDTSVRATAATQVVRTYLEMPVDVDVNKKNDVASEFSLLNELWADLEVLSEDESWVAEMEAISEERKSQHRIKRVGLSLAAGFVLTIAAYLGMNLFVEFEGALNGDRYVSRQGEQKTVTLMDGSVLGMNTNTELLVAYSEEVRFVRVVRGEAFMDVEPKPDQPFKVAVAGKEISVLGTSFNIRTEEDGFTLSVSDGVVALHDAGVVGLASAASLKLKIGVSSRVAAETSVLLSRDQILRYKSDQDAYFITLTEGEVRPDWLDGFLKFKGVTLAEVVKELNRYSTVEIVLDSVELETLKVHAVVNVRDMNATIDLLSKMLPVEIERKFDQIKIRKK